MTNPIAAVTKFLAMLETIVLRPFSAWIIAQDGLCLFDQPIRFAANVTGRDMHQFCAQASCDLEQIFHSLDVGAERLVNRRKEVHPTGTVDDYAHPTLQFFQACGLEPAIGLSDIAVPNRNLAPEQVLTVFLSNFLQSRRAECFLKKPFRGRKVAPRSEENMEVPKFGVAVQNESEQDLAYEAVSPGQQDVVPA